MHVASIDPWAPEAFVRALAAAGLGLPRGSRLSGIRDCWYAAGLVLSAPKVAFEIRAPVEGATVGAPVRLDVALDGSTLGQPSAGLDHLHISLDGGQPIAEYETTQLALSPVPAGRHTLTVELAGPGHQPLLPAKSVGFTVAP